jgi:hypothetical protein
VYAFQSHGATPWATDPFAAPRLGNAKHRASFLRSVTKHRQFGRAQKSGPGIWGAVTCYRFYKPLLVAALFGAPAGGFAVTGHRLGKRRHVGALQKEAVSRQKDAVRGAKVGFLLDFRRKNHVSKPTAQAKTPDL